MKQLRVRAAIQTESWDQYTDRLTALGIRARGVGTNAVVFDHPTMPQTVVKVFSDRDVGYAYYLGWVLRNLHNPYAPHLREPPEYSKKRAAEFAPHHQDSERAYSIAFMEKLEPSDPRQRSVFLERVGSWLTTQGYDRGERGFDTFPRLGIRGWKLLTKYPDPDISDLARCFVRGESLRHHLDLGNSRNILQRGTQLVFTDPFL